MDREAERRRDRDHTKFAIPLSFYLSPFLSETLWLCGKFNCAISFSLIQALVIHISPDAENHQQSDEQVDQRIGAQASAHSEDRRGHAYGIRPYAAAQPADRVHHADRRRPSLRPDHVV